MSNLPSHTDPRETDTDAAGKVLFEWEEVDGLLTPTIEGSVMWPDSAVGGRQQTWKYHYAV